jgi:nitroreductase/NAD-dependent dihydropyrimidine dehydrogenase PreA subunit
MENGKTVVIASARCIGCGLCVKVCPSQTIEIVRGKAEVKEESCISCGHCAAACPFGLIRVPLIDPALYEFKSFAMDEWWLPYGQYDLPGLVKLMASRRSCRNFTAQAVDKSLLEDLVKIGTTAPSGTNSQLWTFTILPTRKGVDKLAGQIADFFGKLNSMAEKVLVRKALKLFGRSELDHYYKNYYPSVNKAVNEWKESGKDRLFHGATSAIVVASKPGASCPSEDALLATQNILLAAHAMGLGTCLIGFAVAAMSQDNNIQRSIGMTSREKVYAVIAVGHPDEIYEKAAGRKNAVIRFYEG